MTDYLTEVSQRASNSTLEVRPVFGASFDPLRTRRFDSASDGLASTDDNTSTMPEERWNSSTVSPANEFESETAGRLDTSDVDDWTTASEANSSQLDDPARKSHEAAPLPNETIGNVTDQSTGQRSDQLLHASLSSQPRLVNASESLDGVQLDLDPTSTITKPFNRSSIEDKSESISRSLDNVPTPLDNRSSFENTEWEPVTARQRLSSDFDRQSSGDMSAEYAPVPSSQQTKIEERIRKIIPLSAARPLPTSQQRSQAVNGPVVPQPPETIVYVTIGRVEVRATSNAQQPVAPRQSVARHVSQGLEDYLTGNSSGRSS